MVDLWFKDSEPRFAALQPGQTFLIKRERRTQGGVFGVSAAQMETPGIFLAVLLIGGKETRPRSQGCSGWVTPPVSLLQRTCAATGSCQFHIHGIALSWASGVVL